MNPAAIITDASPKDAIGLRQRASINGDYREFADTDCIPWVRSTLSRLRGLTV
jgi:hypothetical protein